MGCEVDWGISRKITTTGLSPLNQTRSSIVVCWILGNKGRERAGSGWAMRNWE